MVPKLGCDLPLVKWKQKITNGQLKLGIFYRGKKDGMSDNGK